MTTLDTTGSLVSIVYRLAELAPASGALPAKSGERGADTDHVGRVFNVVGRGKGAGPGHAAIGATDRRQRAVLQP